VHLRTQLEEYRDTKHHGVRATNKLCQLDAVQTANRVGEVVRVFSSAASSLDADTTLSCIIFTCKLVWLPSQSLHGGTQMMPPNCTLSTWTTTAGSSLMS
jgi:hypothetical protein